MRLLEQTVEAEGQRVLGWREVPVDEARVRPAAAPCAPHIAQLFVGAGDGVADQDAFERKLYVIRRVVERDGADELRSPASRRARSSTRGCSRRPSCRATSPTCATSASRAALALVHSRFSTNTFPSWELAHPYRMLAHNGEINTLRGNRNWMRAREMQLASPLFGDDIEKLRRCCATTCRTRPRSTGCMELLVLGGRSPAHAISMMIPEAYQGRPELPEEVRDFFAYHARSSSRGTARRRWPSPTAARSARRSTATACAPDAGS